MRALSTIFTRFPNFYSDDSSLIPKSRKTVHEILTKCKNEEAIVYALKVLEVQTDLFLNPTTRAWTNNPSTRVGHHRVDLNLKVLPLSTGISDFQIFRNVTSLNINLPNSRIKNFHFFEFLIGKFRNRPCGGRLLLRGY